MSWQKNIPDRGNQVWGGGPKGPGVEEQLHGGSRMVARGCQEGVKGREEVRAGAEASSQTLRAGSAQQTSHWVCLTVGQCGNGNPPGLQTGVGGFLAPQLGRGFYPDP